MFGGWCAWRLRRLLFAPPVKSAFVLAANDTRIQLKALLLVLVLIFLLLVLVFNISAQISNVGVIGEVGGSEATAPIKLIIEYFQYLVFHLGTRSTTAAILLKLDFKYFWSHLCMPARPLPAGTHAAPNRCSLMGSFLCHPSLIRGRCSAPGLSAPGTASLAHPDHCPFVRHVADCRLIWRF